MDTILKSRMAPSLGLLTVAALTPREHDVVLADENVRTLDLNDLPDLVAITVNVDTALRAYAIADRYRSRGITVVGGGIHLSAVPEEGVDHFDAVCVGPAEGVWKTMLEDATTGSLLPVYRNSERLDGASIPLPRRELIPSGDYLYTNIVSAGRGCPFKCSFCYNSCAYVDYSIINRPVADVIRELRALGTRHVMFIDDNFIGDPRWTVEFLEELRRQQLGIKWSAAVSTNVGNRPDILDIMAETGCQSLFIGFESISGEANKAIGKSHNRVGTYGPLVAALHRRNIMVNASLVFGLDGDGPEVFERTLAWLVANKVDTMTAHVLTPYPGTKLHERLEAEGRILDRDYAHYSTARAVFSPIGMTTAELEDGYLWMYEAFYSWKSVLRRMPTSGRRIVPYFLFNLLYRKYGRFTARIASYGLLGAVGRWARWLSYGVR